MTAEPPVLPLPESKPPASELNLEIELVPGASVTVKIRTHTPAGITLEERRLEFSNPEPAAELPLPEPTAEGTPTIVDTPDSPPVPQPLVTLPNLRRAAVSSYHNLALSLRTQTMNWLIGAALAVYILTRLIGITAFPIYFFTDEAVQTVLAADLVRDNFRGYDQQWLPTYFENGGQYEMSVSVYAQVLPYLIFGKNQAVTRGVSALFTVIAALSIGLMLKNIFRSSYAWAGVLVLSTVPVWFLHSRTAFETVMAASFYSGMLYSYLKYRQGELRWLYAAVVFAALSFYTYPPAQLVIPLALLLLLLSDARYHWQNRKLFLKALGLGLIFLLPYLRFLLTHPSGNGQQLAALSSYWVRDFTLPQKFGLFFRQLLRGLDPLYWFIPHSNDLVRHVMYGYGHFLTISLPFAALGLWTAVRNFKEPRYRLVLISLLAAPAGAALVEEIGLTRALFIVIPYTLLIALGLSACLRWMERWFHRSVITVGVFVILAGFNFYMLRDALTNGPRWFSDYSLSGMQYGGAQLFGRLNQLAHEQPDLHLVVSPSWANGTDAIARFFSPDPLPYTLESIEGYLYQQREITPNTLFVMIPDEFEAAKASAKFTDLQVVETLPYPDGRDGFYFVRLRYVDDIAQILEQENLQRKALRTEAVRLPDGQTAQVSFSALDMGSIQDAFDSDPETLIRTLEANPIKLKLTFPKNRMISAVTVRVGGTPTQVTLRTADGQQFQVSAEESPDPHDVRLQLNPPQITSEVTIEVWSIHDVEPGHVHVWEVSFE